MQLIDLGRRGYQEALEIQKECLEKRIAGEIPDTLILVEHTPIYTAGRAQTKEGSAPASVVVPEVGPVPVVAVERGGKMTYHGPGQLVGYPVFALTHRDIRQFLRDIERILIATVGKVGLSARPCPETLELEAGQLDTGVWVGDFKIGSIGIAVRQWVSFHGFALNVAPELKYFQAIEPCGFDGHIISSIARERELNESAALDLMPLIKGELVSKFTDLSARYEQLAKSTAESSAGAGADFAMGLA